ncbi:hypothetical protein TNCV_1661181 [Trichonephila clavipes]|nr:hypothetical protein TNCV_1661181 [Trichonephila clavipes]
MLVGLLSRWCFLIGGHGRRHWAGRTGDFGGLRKIKSKYVQADEKLVCYWSSGVGERELYSLRLVRRKLLTVIIKSEVSSSALYLELRCSLCWNFVGGVGVTSREIQCDWLKPVSVVWL